MQISSNGWSLASRWGPALLVMAFIFTFSSIPASSLPDAGVFDLVFKKGGHLLGYALLALAYLRGVGGEIGQYRRVALVLAILFAISDEIHQRFVPGRGSWIVDVGIDGLGAWLALYLPVLAPVRRLFTKF